ncbi:MAG: glycosyltransferase family 39 protein [Planctomycetes bacterium]|nr:glycosyltransferase family 39 protein [Planctomycetota bacterium]
MTDSSTHPLRLSTQHSGTDWLLIAGLVLLVLPLRLWLLYNTEVTARDSIGYIRYALHFEEKSWTESVRENQQHPGYPLMVLAMSQPIRALDGATTPENMVLATQLVSLLASLVLIMPMYWLGRQAFDRPVSFWATLLYQYLPVSAQHLSDGVSEPTYLVFLVSGLLFLARAVRAYRLTDCALCGFFTGLAYLTRPEGLLILPAFGATILAMQFRAPWRCSRLRFVACGATVVLVACAVGSPYAWAVRGLTNKPAGRDLIRNATGHQASTAPGQHHLFAITFPKSDSKVVNLARGVWALTMEVVQGFHYGAAIFLPLGLWWSRRSLVQNPAAWALGAYLAGHALILVGLAMTVGYISDRHVMILVLCGSFFVVAGMRELPRRFLAWRSRTQLSTGPLVWWRSAPVWFAVLLAVLIGACLPRTTQRLHGNRAGNHHAGQWLRAHLEQGDVVYDDHCWSHFFAGLVFQEGKDVPIPRDAQPTCYVVSTRARDPKMDEARQAGNGIANARLVYAWPEGVAPAKARVLVYARPRNQKDHAWRPVP